MVHLSSAPFCRRGLVPVFRLSGWNVMLFFTFLSICHLTLQAFEVEQKYKEGKSILERALVAASCPAYSPTAAMR